MGDSTIPVLLCSECDRTATDHAWHDAWERWGGGDDRMVCPNCGHVHRDDDSSSVEEIR